MKELAASVALFAYTALLVEVSWRLNVAMWQGDDLPRVPPRLAQAIAALVGASLPLLGFDFVSELAYAAIIASACVAATTDWLTQTAHDVAFIASLVGAVILALVGGHPLASAIGAAAYSCVFMVPAGIQFVSGRKWAFGGADVILIFIATLALGPAYGLVFLLLGYACVAMGTLPGMISGRIVLGRGDAVANLPGLAVGFAMTTVLACPHVDALRALGLATRLFAVVVLPSSERLF